MRKGKVVAVVGGQFGSEGKGAVSGWLAKQYEEPVVVRVAGPNAGHSAVDAQGVKWALRQVPAAAVTNPQAKLVIADGSEIDEEVLRDEVKRLDDAGFDVSGRLYVSGQATVIDDHHKIQEGAGDLWERTGSTRKGVGAARAARIMREATVWGRFFSEIGMEADTPHFLAAMLRAGKTVLIEGTQGYGLGLHAGYYPHCTSSDCRAVDFLAMAGICPWWPWVDRVETWVVLRTFPIRVAGNSGPLQDETSWDRLGEQTKGYIQPEFTTVTNKMRRVGRWDPELASRAVAENGGSNSRVALTFFDYWFPELAGVTAASRLEYSHWLQVDEVERQIGSRVSVLGTGPGTVIDLRYVRG